MNRPKVLQMLLAVLATSVFLVGCSSATPIPPSQFPTNTPVPPTASSTFTPSPSATTTPSATPTLTVQEQFDRNIVIGQSAIDSAVSASKLNDVEAVRTALSHAQQAFGDALEIKPDSPDVLNWLSWIETDIDDKYIYVFRIGDSYQIKITEAIQDTSNNDPINSVTWDLSKDYSIEVSSEEEGYVTSGRNIVYPFNLRIPSTVSPGKYALVFTTKVSCFCCAAERLCSNTANEEQHDDCIKWERSLMGIRKCMASNVLVTQHKFTVSVIVFPPE
jgi:hypothetical protein